MAMWGGVPPKIEVTDIVIYASSKDETYRIKRGLMRYLESRSVNMSTLRIIPETISNAAHSVKYPYFWVTSYSERRLQIIGQEIAQFCVDNEILMSVKGVMLDFYIPLDEMQHRIAQKKEV